MNFDWVQNVPKVSSGCCAKWWGLKLGEMPWRVPCLEQHQQIPWQLLRKHLGHCPPGKGLETLADGNFVERKMSTEIFVKAHLWNNRCSTWQKRGTSDLIFKKTSALFVGNCHFNHLNPFDSTTPKKKHRCSALHAPRRPSVQPHWLERRPPPGGIKKLTPGTQGWKDRWKYKMLQKKSPIWYVNLKARGWFLYILLDAPSDELALASTWFLGM